MPFRLTLRKSSILPLCLASLIRATRLGKAGLSVCSQTVPVIILAGDRPVISVSRAKAKDER